LPVCRQTESRLQEHRKEEITFAKKNDIHLITSSAWRNTQQAGTGSVGLLLSKKAEALYVRLRVEALRVMRATFARNPETTAVVAYSPTNISNNDEELEKFCEHMTNS